MTKVVLFLTNQVVDILIVNDKNNSSQSIQILMLQTQKEFNITKKKLKMKTSSADVKYSN